MAYVRLSPEKMKKAISTQKNETIEVMRYIAALSVVFVHIPTVKSGHFGVDIFFVISGFVMMLSTNTSSHQFFLKRVIRIAPTYYFFTITTFIVALLFPRLLDNTTANYEHLIKSLLFIPFDKNGAGHRPILYLGWTLNYEIYFYLLFSFGLALSREYRGVLASIFLLFFFMLFNASSQLPQAAYGSTMVFEFVLGIILYTIVEKRDFKKTCILFFILFFGLIEKNIEYTNRLFVFGFPAALASALMLFIFKDFKFPRILVLLGGASYSLYLTHPYVIQVFEKLTSWFNEGLIKSTIALLLSLIIANGVALIVYRFLEEPTRKFLRMKLLTAI